jgi:hypothetical protein
MGEMAEMGAGHFIYIPATLLLGIVLGWILGSRAALDAYRADLKRREERAQRQAARQAGKSQSAG